VKIYLAGRYSDKNRLSEYAEDLEAAGHFVTSSWLKEPHAPNTTMDQVAPELLEKYAYDDLQDVRLADVMIFFSLDPTEPSFRGGRHVEFGYALALKKTIVVVGPKENIFHYLPTIRHFETWESALHRFSNPSCKS
jgi:nucleoside 2-deoxyribosyltransferase